MAKQIDITAEHHFGLYDSATGRDCVIEKLVDVTEDCPGLAGARVLLLFTRSQRGLIVQMRSPYPGEEFLGMYINFFVDELEREMDVHPRDDTFGSWAGKLGLSKSELISLIRTHAR